MKSLFRSALVLTGTLAAAIFSSAQTAPPAPPVALTALSAGPAGSASAVAPIIQFNTEVYDQGKTIAGAPFRYTFQVTNAGDGPLEITRAQGSCHCTTATWTTNIPSHGNGEIPIVIQTEATQLGTIEKTVTVTSNDPKRPNVILRIRVLCWVPIQVSPAQTVIFSIMPDGTPTASQVLHIFNRTEEPLVLSPPVSDTPAFSAVLKTNVPGQEFELTVSPGTNFQRPPSTGATSVLGTISMQTSSTNMPDLKINASAVINPEILYFPNQIQLPRGPLNQPWPQWIQIRDNTRRGLKVSEPAINVPGVDVSLIVMTTNLQYSMVVKFPPGFEVKPGSDVVATVKTDNPNFPILRIPVTASLSPPPGMLQPRKVFPPPGQRLTNGQVRPFMPQPVQVAAPRP